MILQTNQFEDAVPKVNVMSEDDENRSSTSSMVTKANKLLAQKLMGNLGTNLVGMDRDKSEISNNCPCTEVLVADDNEFNLITFQSLLKMHGIEASSASNGCEAIEKVNA